jgi:hypothetical protein
MNLKLFAVAGIGLLAGACSLRPLGVPAAYSSLPASDAQVHASVKASPHPVASTASGFGAVTLAPPIPGDVVGALPEPRGSRIDPVASLNASAQARMNWETLRPGNLTRAPLLQSRLAAALGAIGRDDVRTGSVGAELPPPPAMPHKSDDYDRDAAMLHLIQGGRLAARKICEGC